MFARLRTPIKDVTESIHMFAIGTTEADIADIKNKAEKTIHKWIKKATTQCLRFNNYFLKGITPYFLQFDELFAFVRTRANKQCDWTSMDAYTRLLLGFVIGDRSNKSAERILDITKSRIKTNPILITSDGLQRYTERIPQMFPTSLYAQVVKKHENRKLVEIEVRPMNGSVEKIVQIIESMGLGHAVNTSYTERLNLTIRNSVNSLARKTWCVAKKYLAIVGKMHVFQTFYNFVRIHMSLSGRTPAMVAGVADHVWNWYELLTYKL